MILNPNMFKKVTIVGVGLMGGSLGLALKKYRLAKEIVGLSQSQESLHKAVEIKAIDVAETDVEKAVKNADLVVLAAPVESIIKLFSTINPHLKRGCIITDLGSAKTEIVEASKNVLSAPGFFVGSHPLVGSEKRGVEFSREDLFENAMCMMTPIKESNSIAKEKIKQLWTKVGAKIFILSPQEHDQILAYISHLPHLMAFGLLEIIPEKFLEYATAGLRDTTRIAGSSPQMWSDICMTNSKNILTALDQFVEILSDMRRSIMQQDKKSLLDHISKANELHKKIN
ncbi:MAG: prephenate dehydrogenase/arogenate dehydrogenase family protein [Candidatus Omnitrophica bacterium]|nr:prephenate dehydrogenase/arogenate dehydrogenase family protein [Candidatus Omnitrophota bacterium]